MSDKKNQILNILKGITSEETAELLLELREEITIHEESAKINKPKVELYDIAMSSKDSIDMSKVAKTLGIIGMGRNKLFKLLRFESVLMNNNDPYQSYVDNGYFEVIEQPIEVGDGVLIKHKTLVTQRGLDFIRKLIGKVL